ncbi:hypothetical protein MHYP_G00003100 [Metynnis hypsauchen]
MLLLAVLQLVQWMATALASNGPPPDCCNKVTDTKIKVAQISRYVYQDPALCPVRAVRIISTKNRVICSDPESNWTKNAMRLVDNRDRKSKPSIYRGSTTVNWTMPPMTTTSIPVMNKDTASTMFTTPSLPTGSTTARYSTQLSSLMTEPPTTTKATQQTTPRTTQRTSTEMRMTTLTTVTTVMPQTPPVESEASTSSMTTSHTATSKKTAESTEQFPLTMIPPAQKSTPIVTVPSRHSPSLTSNKTQNPIKTSIITTAASAETPKVTRLPWTLRRLKKKSKSALRKAQRRRG